jgi:flagellar biosynthesis chaperone FliJ
VADAIARLLRLRTAQADAARRDLADALREAEAASLRVETARVALRREAEAAPTDALHPLAGAYAAWLPAGRAAIARAGAEASERQAEAEAARAALAAARMEARACETLAEAQAAARRVAREKAAQVAMEDGVRRRGG